MSATILPIISHDPVTFGAEYLALESARDDAWKKAMQALHPKLLPQLKESALLSEEDSPYCASGQLFDYPRGQELVLDGTAFTLSHCAEHFLDFLQPSAECLKILEENASAVANCNSTEEERARLFTLRQWWQQGYQVFVLQHQ